MKKVLAIAVAVLAVPLLLSAHAAPVVESNEHKIARLEKEVARLQKEKGEVREERDKARNELNNLKIRIEANLRQTKDEVHKINLVQQGEFKAIKDLLEKIAKEKEKK